MPTCIQSSCYKLFLENFGKEREKEKKGLILNLEMTAARVGVCGGGGGGGDRRRPGRRSMLLYVSLKFVFKIIVS